MAVFSSKLPYKVRCSLPDCQKPTNYVFREELDGVMCNFCSSYHAQIGEDRWEEKKKLNIRMGVPPKKEEEEFTAENIPGSGGGDEIE